MIEKSNKQTRFKTANELFFLPSPGNRVVPAAAPGIAAQNPLDAQIAAVKQAVGFERANHIMRARRIVTAGLRL